MNLVVPGHNTTLNLIKSLIQFSTGGLNIVCYTPGNRSELAVVNACIDSDPTGHKSIVLHDNYADCVFSKGRVQVVSCYVPARVDMADLTSKPDIVFCSSDMPSCVAGLLNQELTQLEMPLIPVPGK